MWVEPLHVPTKIYKANSLINLFNMRLEEIVQLETMLDHLTGEETGLALEFLNEMPEVLDAICLTGIGKKNRPCSLLQALCRPENEEKVVAAIFRHTHSLGIRRVPLQRYALDRETGPIKLAGHPARAKFYEIDGQAYARPEADSIRELAARTGQGAPGLRILKKS